MGNFPRGQGRLEIGMATLGMLGITKKDGDYHWGYRHFGEWRILLTRARLGWGVLVNNKGRYRLYCLIRGIKKVTLYNNVFLGHTVLLLRESYLP